MSDEIFIIYYLLTIFFSLPSADSTKQPIYINRVIRGGLLNSIEQLKCKTPKSLAPKEFNLVENINQNSVMK